MNSSNVFLENVLYTDSLFYLVQKCLSFTLLEDMSRPGRDGKFDECEELLPWTAHSLQLPVGMKRVSFQVKTLMT